jgi:DNA-binding MarR family transcriptional regulator
LQTSEIDASAIADRLHSAAIHLLRGVAREDVRSGLSAARLSALSVVVFGGPVTLGELATAERVQPPTMTRIVQALERDGLVRRRRSKTDGRVVELAATPKGHRRLAAARERRIEKLAAALGELHDHELTVVVEALAPIEAVAQKVSAEPGSARRSHTAGSASA